MIKKTSIFLLTMIFCITSSCSTFQNTADEKDQKEPAEYTEDEFPKWLRDIRRAEIIFAGSLPFTILLTSIGYGAYSAISSGIGDGYSIEDFTGTEERTTEERYRILSISLGLSGGIALTDFILGLTDKPADEK